MEVCVRYAQDKYMKVSVDLETGAVLLHIEAGELTGDYEFSLGD